MKEQDLSDRLHRGVESRFEGRAPRPDLEDFLTRVERRTSRRHRVLVTASVALLAVGTFGGFLVGRSGDEPAARTVLAPSNGLSNGLPRVANPSVRLEPRDRTRRVPRSPRRTTTPTTAAPRPAKDAALQYGKELDAARRQATDQALQHGYTTDQLNGSSIEVLDVSFIDPSHAAVRFTITVPGHGTVLQDRVGYAVVDRGRWKVAAANVLRRAVALGPAPGLPVPLRSDAVGNLQGACGDGRLLEEEPSNIAPNLISPRSPSDRRSGHGIGRGFPARQVTARRMHAAARAVPRMPPTMSATITRRSLLRLGAATAVALAIVDNGWEPVQSSSEPSRRAFLTTDFAVPPIDADDYYDVACAIALGFAGIVLDHPTDPAIAAIGQLGGTVVAASDLVRAQSIVVVGAATNAARYGRDADRIVLFAGDASGEPEHNVSLDPAAYDALVHHSYRVPCADGGLWRGSPRTSFLPTDDDVLLEGAPCRWWFEEHVATGPRNLWAARCSRSRSATPGGDRPWPGARSGRRADFAPTMIAGTRELLALLPSRSVIDEVRTSSPYADG